MGESFNLIDNFKIDNVIFNKGNYNDLEKKLIYKLEKKDIKYFNNIKKLNINKNKFYFINDLVYDNENDNSNILYFEFNKYKFLFMGDSSKIVENNILNKYDLDNIDVLKVGLHGSNTSSCKEFIEKINTKYSVISVGENNRYNHPNKDVLDNLKNSYVLRTDVNGSIMFEIKNNSLRVDKIK